MKAVMYGAGNIGRGFIGQLFSESGYEVIFIDVNPVIVEQMNRDHAYPVNIVSEAGNSEVLVENIRAIDGHDSAAVSAAISEADVMATAVGVNVLPTIARPIAEGLARRWSGGNSCPLNIIICENLIDANQYLKKLVAAELALENRALLDEYAGFVEASVGRMVPVMTPEMQSGNVLRVMVEPYCELPVDRNGFRGEIPFVCNMVPASPFSFYIQRKLYIHNMGHALIAYLGRIRGYEFIWQAVQDQDIECAGRAAMYAAAQSLAVKHGVELAGVKAYADDLLARFGNRQLGDTVQRVGRDILRKLSPDDRLIGALNLCISQNVDPSPIILGIQAAIGCAIQDEPGLFKTVEAPGVIAVIDKLTRQIFAARSQPGPL